jgi:large subunit ribosomal protein L31
MQKMKSCQYHSDTKVSCACGHSFTTGSTLKEIKIEICSQCHPFFTGQMKYIDTMGRVERFQKLQQAAAAKKYIKKKDRKNVKKKEAVRPVTLKEMIQMEKRKTQPKKK